MTVKTKGAEFKRFYFDPTIWPDGPDATWHEDEEVTIDGEPAEDGDLGDVADTAKNAEFFGRPGVSKGERAAFPQTRMAALAECGTHAVEGVRFGV